VAYLGYTLRMRTLFRGWPIMVNDTHTRRRRRLRENSWLQCRQAGMVCVGLWSLDRDSVASRVDWHVSRHWCFDSFNIVNLPFKIIHDLPCHPIYPGWASITEVSSHFTNRSSITKKIEFNIPSNNNAKLLLLVHLILTKQYYTFAHLQEF